jgi:hypothetical protein
MSYWQEHGHKFDIHGMTLDEKVKQLCSVRAHNVNVVLKLTVKMVKPQWTGSGKPLANITSK